MSRGRVARIEEAARQVATASSGRRWQQAVAAATEGWLRRAWAIEVFTPGPRKGCSLLSSSLRSSCGMLGRDMQRGERSWRA